MSVIGPRPALWNQDVLIAEREKYHANDVRNILLKFQMMRCSKSFLLEISGRHKVWKYFQKQHRN